MQAIQRGSAFLRLVCVCARLAEMNFGKLIGLHIPVIK